MEWRCSSAAERRGKMEPYHGRRGKESGGVCGMNRAHPTMLLMVAMVATMAVVLLCESPPLVASGVAQSPVLKCGLLYLPQLAAPSFFLSDGRMLLLFCHFGLRRLWLSRILLLTLYC